MQRLKKKKVSILSIEFYIKSDTQTCNYSYLGFQDANKKKLVCPLCGVENKKMTNHLGYKHNIPAGSEERKKYLRMAWNGNVNRGMKVYTHMP